MRLIGTLLVAAAVSFLFLATELLEFGRPIEVFDFAFGESATDITDSFLEVTGWLDGTSSGASSCFSFFGL